MSSPRLSIRRTLAFVLAAWAPVAWAEPILDRCRGSVDQEAAAAARGASATAPLPYVVEFEKGSASGIEGQTLWLTLRRRLADETANGAWSDVSVTTPNMGAGRDPLCDDTVDNAEIDGRDTLVGPTRVELALVVPEGSAATSADVAFPSVVEFSPSRATSRFAVSLVQDTSMELFDFVELRIADVRGGDAGAKDRVRIDIRDDDPCGTPDFPGSLNALLRQLDPNEDHDGDGFTTGEELEVFNFNPRNDVARFNPLIADTPVLDFRMNNDLSLEIFDSLNREVSTRVLRLSEDEKSTRNATVETERTETTHNVGFSVSGGGGGSGANEKTFGEKETKKKERGGQGAGNAEFHYDWTKTKTTEKQKIQENTTRSRNVSEFEEAVSEGHAIDGGALAVSVTLRNPGNVSYQLDRIGILVRMLPRDWRKQELLGETPTDEIGELIGTLLPDPLLADRDHNLGLTLPANCGEGDAGCEVVLGLSLEIQQASLVQALAEDLSDLRFVVDRGFFKLSKIGSSTASFDSYIDQVRAKTARVSIVYPPTVLADPGPGLGPVRYDDRPPAEYLVATGFERGAFGAEAGTPICTVLGAVLGLPFGLDSGDVTVTLEGGEERQLPATWLSMLGRRLRAGGTEAFSSDIDLGQYWIIDAPDSESWTSARFRFDEIRMFQGEAIQLTLHTDEDGDGVPLHTEALFGSSDRHPDTDLDGLLDRAEINVAHEIVVDGQSTFSFSHPALGDSDADGLRDNVEVSVKPGSGEEPWESSCDPGLDSCTDPSRADTDSDGEADGIDDLPLDGRPRNLDYWFSDAAEHDGGFLNYYDLPDLVFDPPGVFHGQAHFSYLSWENECAERTKEETLSGHAFTSQSGYYFQPLELVQRDGYWVTCISNDPDANPPPATNPERKRFFSCLAGLGSDTFVASIDGLTKDSDTSDADEAGGVRFGRTHFADFFLAPVYSNSDTVKVCSASNWADRHEFYEAHCPALTVRDTDITPANPEAAQGPGFSFVGWIHTTQDPDGLVRIRCHNCRRGADSFEAYPWVLAGQPGNLGLMLIPDPSGQNQAVLRLGPLPCLWKENDAHPTDRRDELQEARACELTGLPSIEAPINQLWSETPTGRNPHWAMIAGVAETTKTGTRLSLFVNGVRISKQDLPATSIENRTGNCTSLVLGANTLTCDGRTVNYELVGKRINEEKVWGLGGEGSAVDNVQIYREPLTPRQIQMIYDRRFPANTDDCGIVPPPA